MERRIQGQNKLCCLDQKVNVRRSLQVKASADQDHSFPLEEDKSSTLSLQDTRTPFLQMLQDPSSSVLSLKDPNNILGNYEAMSSQEVHQLDPLDSRRRNNNLVTSSVSREKRKRRRSKPMKNREEMESQRMTHIAVERNRRRQMNVHLNSLRSLIPSSYLLRGDQASIVGGAIDFVKILEQHLQSLEAQKITSKLRVDATVVERQVNLKIQYCQRKQGQLVRSIYLLQKLGLTALHLNITSPCTSTTSLSYSFSLKMEDECNLRSADEITAAVRQIFECC